VAGLYRAHRGEDLLDLQQGGEQLRQQVGVRRAGGARGLEHALPLRPPDRRLEPGVDLGRRPRMAHLVKLGDQCANRCRLERGVGVGELGPRVRADLLAVDLCREGARRCPERLGCRDAGLPAHALVRRAGLGCVDRPALELLLDRERAVVRIEPADLAQLTSRHRVTQRDGAAKPERICDGLSVHRPSVPHPLTEIAPEGLGVPALAASRGIGESLTLRPEIADLSMSGSSVVVAVNALALKRLRLPRG
jgi:hypothetical protein